MPDYIDNNDDKTVDDNTTSTNQDDDTTGDSAITKTPVTQVGTDDETTTSKYPELTSTITKMLKDKDKNKYLLQEEKSPTSEDYFPSTVEKDKVTTDEGTVPIFAPSILYPYALLDKRTNALMRQAKMKQLFADKIDLTPPETFYKYQPVLSNNFIADTDALLQKEKAKGGNWFARSSDPNSDLMKKVREYQEYAKEMSEDAKTFEAVNKKLEGTDADKYYLPQDTRNAMSNYLNAYGEFAEDPSKMPIEKLRTLAAKAHLSQSYDFILDSKAKDLLKPGGVDIDTYFNGQLQDAKDLAASKGETFNYQDWYNKTALNTTKKFLDPDKADDIATEIMRTHPDVMQQFFNDGTELEEGTDAWDKVHDTITNNLLSKVGTQVKSTLQKLEVPESEWSKQAAIKAIKDKKVVTPQSTTTTDVTTQKFAGIVKEKFKDDSVGDGYVYNVTDSDEQKSLTTDMVGVQGVSTYNNADATLDDVMYIHQIITDKDGNRLYGVVGKTTAPSKEGEKNQYIVPYNNIKSSVESAENSNQIELQKPETTTPKTTTAKTKQLSTGKVVTYNSTTGKWE